jgi:hypothetical protein
VVCHFQESKRVTFYALKATTTINTNAKCDALNNNSRIMFIEKSYVHPAEQQNFEAFSPAANFSGQLRIRTAVNNCG